MIPFLTTAENFRLVKATGFSFTGLMVAPQGAGSTFQLLRTLVCNVHGLDPSKLVLVSTSKLGRRAVGRDADPDIPILKEAKAEYATVGLEPTTYGL